MSDHSKEKEERASELNGLLRRIIMGLQGAPQGQQDPNNWGGWDLHTPTSKNDTPVRDNRKDQDQVNLLAQLNAHLGAIGLQQVQKCPEEDDPAAISNWPFVIGPKDGEKSKDFTTQITEQPDEAIDLGESAVGPKNLQVKECWTLESHKNSIGSGQPDFRQAGLGSKSAFNRSLASKAPTSTIGLLTWPQRQLAGRLASAKESARNWLSSSTPRASISDRGDTASIISSASSFGDTQSQWDKDHKRMTRRGCRNPRFGPWTMFLFGMIVGALLVFFSFLALANEEDLSTGPVSSSRIAPHQSSSFWEEMYLNSTIRISDLEKLVDLYKIKDIDLSNKLDDTENNPTTINNFNAKGTTTRSTTTTMTPLMLSTTVKTTAVTPKTPIVIKSIPTTPTTLTTTTTVPTTPMTIKPVPLTPTATLPSSTQNPKAMTPSILTLISTTTITPSTPNPTTTTPSTKTMTPSQLITAVPTIPTTTPSSTTMSPTTPSTTTMIPTKLTTKVHATIIAIIPTTRTITTVTDKNGYPHQNNSSDLKVDTTTTYLESLTTPSSDRLETVTAENSSFFVSTVGPNFTTERYNEMQQDKINTQGPNLSENLNKIADKSDSNQKPDNTKQMESIATTQIPRKSEPEPLHETISNNSDTDSGHRSGKSIDIDHTVTTEKSNTTLEAESLINEEVKQNQDAGSVDNSKESISGLNIFTTQGSINTESNKNNFGLATFNLTTESTNTSDLNQRKTTTVINPIQVDSRNSSNHNWTNTDMEKATTAINTNEGNKQPPLENVTPNPGINLEIPNIPKGFDDIKISSPPSSSSNGGGNGDTKHRDANDPDSENADNFTTDTSQPEGQNPQLNAGKTPRRKKKKSWWQQAVEIVKAVVKKVNPFKGKQEDTTLHIDIE